MRRLQSMAGLAWALGSLLLAVGLYAGARAAPGVAPFVLETIRIEGANRTRPGTVLEAGGVKAGMGLFAVDVNGLRRAAEALPWVRRAKVLRQIPSTLTVQVEEWTPAYLVRLDRLYYLSPEAHVIKAPLDQGLDYPVLTGLTWAGLESPGPLREALLELLGEVEERFTPAEVSEVHAEEDSGFTLYLAGGQGLYLGTAKFGEKFDRLARLNRHLARRGQKARAVSLAFEDKIIARLEPAAEGGVEP